ncbi:hypothetical protein M1271_06725 [Patescibacteria group bacterium]|nr:hypothetical protein [Patescibacteria group bacterium]
MNNKIVDRPKLILDILEENLTTHSEVVKLLGKVRARPETVEVLLGELDSAIYAFNRYKNANFLKNAKLLADILGKNDLPESKRFLEYLESEKSTGEKRERLFSEMNKFKFLDEKATGIKLFGRILVALYRTYILQNISGIRKRRGQVASTLEEMLALMALEGFETHLFRATEHWIVDWENEGFSEELATKIKTLENQ